MFERLKRFICACFGHELWWAGEYCWERDVSRCACGRREITNYLRVMQWRGDKYGW